MSSIVENFTHEINGLAYSEAEKEKRNPDGKKKYRPHLATKVKWALEDAMDRSIAAQKHMRIIHQWLVETHKFDIDDHAKAHLGKLELELFGLAVEVSEMERILAAALAESKPAKDATKDATDERVSG